MDTRIAYTVKAEFEDKSLIESFHQWLENGHIKDVLDCGGESCSIVKNLDAEIPYYECRYIFPSKASLDIYFEKDAPRLRQEGLTKFPTGIKFSRTIGEVVLRF